MEWLWVQHRYSTGTAVFPALSCPAWALVAASPSKQRCRLWTPGAAAHKSLLTCLHVVQPSFPPSVLVLLLILLHTWAFCTPTAPGRCRCQEAGSSFIYPPLLFRASSKHLTVLILMWKYTQCDSEFTFGSPVFREGCLV